MSLKKETKNYREALVQRLKALTSGTILDAGTGAGSMTKALSNGLTLPIVSIDVNRRVFPYVFKKVDRDRVQFITCDFSHLPFKDNVLCGIVCDLVISTSREWKPSLAYAEFKRTLKTDSSVFITDYYPEKSPRTREALLANETSMLYRDLFKAKGTKVPRSVSPDSSVKQLKNTGFAAVKKQKIEANETQEWKKRVFKEYLHGMETGISALEDLKLKDRFTKRLTRLKHEIHHTEKITWGWGVNYLIVATK